MSAVANVAINIDARDATGQLRQLQGQAGQTEKAFSGLTAVVGKLAIAATAIQAARFVFAKTAELETQTRSLQVLTGSAEKAKAIIQELQQLGAVTPFTSTELIDAAKRLQAFGVEANKVVETTKRLADVSGATGAELQGLVTAYGQVQAKGRLQGEELLQFQQRGIALQEELRRMYGMSGDEFQKALSKGQISAKAVEVAVQRLTDAGGKYANGAIAQSDTLAGKFSTLQDGVENLARILGTGLAPAVKAVLDYGISKIDATIKLVGDLGLAWESAARSIQPFLDGLTLVQSYLNQIQIPPWLQRLAQLGPQGLQGMTGVGATLNILGAVRGAVGSAAASERGRATLYGRYAEPSQQVRQPRVGETVGSIPPLLGGTSGGGSGRSGKTDAERAAEAAREEAERVQQVLRERSAQVEIDEVRFKLQQQLAAEEKAGDTVAAARLRGAQSLIDAQYQYAQLLADPKNKDARLQEMLTVQGIADLTRVQVNTEAEVNNILDARSAEYNRILAAAQLDLQLAKEKDPLKRAELQIDQLLSSEAYQKLQLTDAQVEALRSVLLETEKIKTKTEETIQIFADMSSTFAGTFGSAIDAMLAGTDELGASLQNLGVDLLKSISKMMIMYGIAQALGALGGGDSTGFFSYLAKGFGYTPKRAMGGPVTAGQPYMVGERGPELFVPSSGGTIVPNGQAGGNGVAVTVNVDAKGTQVQGNDQQGNQLGRVISAAVQQELIKQQRPGGLLAAR